MDNDDVIKETVLYDPVKHWKMKRSLAVRTKKGDLASLVHPQPNDILFDVKEAAKLDKKFVNNLVEQLLGKDTPKSK